jgi:ABC-type Fe2+-enterobactin transport system substrate-binding protein
MAIRVSPDDLLQPPPLAAVVVNTSSTVTGGISAIFGPIVLNAITDDEHSIPDPSPTARIEARKR